jgi:hypothetical protein
MKQARGCQALEGTRSFHLASCFHHLLLSISTQRDTLAKSKNLLESTLRYQTPYDLACDIGIILFLWPTCSGR